MNRKCFRGIVVVVFVTLWSQVGYSQYLRDSTKFVGLDALYPRDDSLVLNQYKEIEKHPLTLDALFSIPEVMVGFDGREFPFYFDFGNSGNLTITTAIADSLNYVITDTGFTYTPDGRIRGEVYSVVIPEFQTLRKIFENENATLAPWSVYSSTPFNGLVGLKYVDGQCFTLSYPRKTLAVSDHSKVPAFTSGNNTIIPLEHFAMHPYGVHFKGKINGQDVMIYFDTGKSHSALNQNLFPKDQMVSDKSGSFFRGTVQIEMGDRTFDIDYPRVKNTQRDIESDLPVGIEIGSDILKYLLLTIDRTHGQNLLIIHG